MKAVSLRVLVVDDHPGIRQLLRLALEPTPLDVVAEAADGVEALERTRALAPDLVLMDIVMPRLDGIAATRQIKESFPEVLVVGFSGTADEDLRRMIQAGAAAVVSKEDFPDLIKLVHDLTKKDLRPAHAEIDLSDESVEE